MKKKWIKAVLLSTLSCSLHADFAKGETDPVLMTIAGEKITKSEFESIYNKNNIQHHSADQKALDEYVQLFINYKLKVKEAETLGIDTSAAFKNELEGYRKQLAQPYLNDNQATDQLIKEAYERMKTDVRASHILIKVDPNALPKDTLKAYNTIMEIRNRIVKGENFANVAREASQDPSVKDNAGDLGYFTAMQMVYPFETAAYNTKPGEISMPVRTRFGYHIIKVVDKRPAQGQILTAHIMVKYTTTTSTEDSTAARNKINEIYAKVKAGEDFAKLAETYSDDKGSAKKGGELPMFGTGRMVPEFEKAAFALKNNGDISEPILSPYGWHIIKRIDKKDIASFDEIKNELKSRIAKDSRAQRSRESLIARIKKENDFKEKLKSRDEFVKVIDTSYFEGKWSAEKAKKLGKTLFTLGGKEYKQSDFAKFLESRQSKRAKMDIAIMVNSLYKQFVDETLIAFEESKLEEKYPDFKALMKEYREGILLFNLTDQNVWSKAIKDTIGLLAFYDKNKNNYMWDERLDATIYTCANEKVAKQTRKILFQSKKQKSIIDEDVLKEINKDSELNLKIENGKFLKNENQAIDKVKWEQGTSENMNINNQVVFVVVHEKLSPEPKTLNEARGLVTADYQSFLEKEWINELRKKYPVTINQSVLATVKP